MPISTAAVQEEVRQEHGACRDYDGADGRQSEDGAKNNSRHQGEAQEMPGDPNRRSIDQGRKKERQDQIRIDVGLRQPWDEGREDAHREQQERLRHTDQARKRQKRADCDQDESCEVIPGQDDFLGLGSP